MIRVIIADDHPIFRTGVREILHQSSLVELVGEANNGMEAYQLIISLRPDIAILDLEMPLLTGLDVCQKVLNEKSNTRFIILTMHKEQSYFNAAMTAGVDGYLLKDSASVNLIECITAVHKQQTYVSPDIDQFLTINQAQQSIDKILEGLTPTEKIILKLIAQGKTSVEIAGLLFISPNTVDNHRSNMTKKLNLEGKNALLKFVMQYQHLFDSAS